MSAIESVMLRIDWLLLRMQKAYLFNEANNDAENGHIYDGMVCLIDALQDAAVADGLATEEEVFGSGEEIP